MEALVAIQATAQEAKPFELVELIPSGATLVVVIIALFVIRFVLGKARSSPTKSFRIQTIMIVLTVIGLILVALMLPNADGTRDAVMALIGIVLSATIALSSTTILGNALAGIQLRVVGAFQSGDFLRVDKHFGRVTERGLFHTEIQTEDRDLTTFPNLFLVTHPYKVVRASGTIISATVSLGYDAPHARVQDCLIAAAAKVGLADPFVKVDELGDYSVTYRIAGLLTEVKQILSTRSTLRKRVLDELHDAGIEIVSPTYMTTRSIRPDAVVVPEHAIPEREPDTRPPEAIMFDKAEDAEALMRSQTRLQKVAEEIAEAGSRLKASAGDEKREVEREIEALQRERESLTEAVAELEERIRLSKEDDS